MEPNCKNVSLSPISSCKESTCHSHYFISCKQCDVVMSWDCVVTDFATKVHYSNLTIIMVKCLSPIVDSFAFLEVHVKAPEHEYHNVCPSIQEATFSGLKSGVDVLKYNNSTPVPAFLCECSSPPHTAIPDRKFCYLMCTKCTEYGSLTQQHSIWLDMKLPPTPAAG